MAPPGAIAREPLPFDRLELAAIAIGKRDPLPWLPGDGRLARVVRLVFGIVPARPLAHPRLEALRLLVLVLRRTGRNPRAAIDAALSAGATRSQVDHLMIELRGMMPGPAPSTAGAPARSSLVRKHHEHACRTLYQARNLAALDHRRPHAVHAVLR